MSGFEDYFSVQVFLIVLRETLELAIIISVLLAFVQQSFKPKEAVKYDSIREPDSLDESASTYKYLRLQIWAGGLLGLVLCLFIGSIILSVFYILGNDLWAVAEHYWEGTFSILASIIISVMGIKILRVSKMQENWKRKLSAILVNSDSLNKAVEGHKSNSWSVWSEKYSMFILPFVTTLREGMEAIVFIGGIGINENTLIQAIINSLIVAVVIGSSIGVLLYRSGNTLSLQWFLITSTCFLYLVAAGLFSKGVWNFELQQFINKCDGFDVSETGHGPGSYDISNSVWHVNCCNGELQDDDAFWMMFTAIFGWTNSATYGSIFGYLFYWIVVIAAFSALLHEEKNGHLPVIPLKWQAKRMRKRIGLNNLPTPTRESIDSINSETPLVG
ncbi:iron permease [Suhomyces tanzawaensis NRRL Y-17324]|uniref:Iron permease n=1 Tax=Suhomyces tanzawaensis NRRL Y-17324 TaxID=984487 RepID=A0A1E4SF67_9ASCO|nr:iron permease [Suhomyces tanzawaensis NRRL Y-17324]ODV78042.1 iron permease [Suhomyces tanzawaensis NRRL Y-17324]